MALSKKDYTTLSNGVKAGLEGLKSRNYRHHSVLEWKFRDLGSVAKSDPDEFRAQYAGMVELANKIADAIETLS